MISTVQTTNVDIHPLGSLFYYVMTSGEHPFGDDIYRDVNILAGEFVGDLRHLDQNSETTHHCVLLLLCA